VASGRCDEASATRPSKSLEIERPPLDVEAVRAPAPPSLLKSPHGGRDTLSSTVASRILFGDGAPSRGRCFVACFSFGVAPCSSGCKGRGRRCSVFGARSRRKRPARKLPTRTSFFLRPTTCRTLLHHPPSGAARFSEHHGEHHDAAHLSCVFLGDEAGWSVGQGPSPASTAPRVNPSSTRRRRQSCVPRLAVPVRSPVQPALGALQAGPAQQSGSFPAMAGQPAGSTGVKVRALGWRENRWRNR